MQCPSYCCCYKNEKKTAGSGKAQRRRPRPNVVTVLTTPTFVTSNQQHLPRKNIFNMGDAEIAVDQRGASRAVDIDDVTPVTVTEQTNNATTGGGGGAEMIFRDVCVDASDKRILWGVSGKARPGQMLALMGPSGK